MHRFSDSGRNNSGGNRARLDTDGARRHPLKRWFPRLAALLVLAIGVTLAFGVDGRSSEALKIKHRAPAPRAAPLMPTPSQVTIIPPALPEASANLPQMASNAALELAGSGDGSSIRWFSDWGLWGNHDAPPGARVNWGSPYWWQSALDLRALIRYLEATHDSNPFYQRIIARTYWANVHRPGTPVPVNFGNDFMDDTIWWGLAWLEAARYELNIRHDLADAKRFMKVAEWDAHDAWRSPRSCHTQGIAWQIGFPPDTITNDEFIALAGGLAQLEEQPGPWLNRAAASKWITDGWRILWWLRHSRLINLATGHVYDGYDARCRPEGGALTYTEGETADALVQMGLATGQHAYLTDAHHFIRYALSPVTGMVYNGVVQEPCEAQAGRCVGGGHSADAAVWKAVLVDAIADWQAATGSREYNAFLIRQAEAVIDHSASNGTQLTRCQTPHDCQIGFYWAHQISPPQQVPVGPGSQESGLSALTDALSTSSGFTG